MRHEWLSLTDIVSNFFSEVSQLSFIKLIGSMECYKGSVTLFVARLLRGREMGS